MEMKNSEERDGMFDALAAREAPQVTRRHISQLVSHAAGQSVVWSFFLLLHSVLLLLLLPVSALCVCACRLLLAKSNRERVCGN